MRCRGLAAHEVRRSGLLRQTCIPLVLNQHLAAVVQFELLQRVVDTHLAQILLS